jgi:hypothetical protein
MSFGLRRTVGGFMKQSPRNGDFDEFHFLLQHCVHRKQEAISSSCEALFDVFVKIR